MPTHSPATSHSRAITSPYLSYPGRARRGRQEFLMLDVDHNEAWEYATAADDFQLPTFTLEQKES
jgi:hypothetical protein